MPRRSLSKYKELYDKLGSDNIYGELIQSYPCNNIEELKANQNEVRRLYKANNKQNEA